MQDMEKVPLAERDLIKASFRPRVTNILKRLTQNCRTSLKLLFPKIKLKGLYIADKLLYVQGYTEPNTLIKKLIKNCHQAFS